MDDAFIMYIDCFHNPSFLAHGRGTGGRLASPTVGCEECGQPLIETRVNHHFIRMCDNWQCKLYRERQGIRSINSRVTWPSYPKWLRRRRPDRYKRYWDLRAGGLTSGQAMRYRDTTSMTVKQIIKMFERERNQ